MWLQHLSDSLPDLGHRNWIIVADAAYPEMVYPGIVTLNSHQALMPVLIQVMDLLDKARHVTPDVVLDREWFDLSDEECPGISRLRLEAKALFDGLKVEPVWHGDLLSLLAEISQTYTIIVIKTTSTLPYTSVFLRLECGYWTEDQERNFRMRLGEDEA